jgi:hypothetical protein
MPFQPGVYDFFVYQFSDWSMDVGWRINEFPVDPSSFTAAMAVRSDASSGKTIVFLSTDNGRITVSDAWLHLRLEREATGELPTGKFVYDISVDDGTTAWPLVRGRFVVRGGITGGNPPNLVAEGVDHG